MSKTVLEVGHQSLYHYQSFNSEHIERTLLENRIKFSNPGSFNDPWDCKPCFSKTLLDRPEIYSRHIGYFIDNGRIAGLSHAELVLLEERLKEDRDHMEMLIDRCTSAIHRGVDAQYRVYCLSSKPNDFLMWAHYTGSHKGICLGFKTHSDTFCGAQRVDYLEEYPLIDLTSKNQDEFMTQSLLSKAKQWEYEDEFRLIAKEKQAEGFLTVHDDFYQVKPEELETVIVGCMIQESDLNSLRKILVKRPGKVHLQRVKPKLNEYSLELATIEY